MQGFASCPSKNVRNAWVTMMSRSLDLMFLVSPLHTGILNIMDHRCVAVHVTDEFDPPPQQATKAMTANEFQTNKCGLRSIWLQKEPCNCPTLSVTMPKQTNSIKRCRQKCDETPKDLSNRQT
eukprot:4421400-Amphidinium_carterae.1